MTTKYVTFIRGYKCGFIIFFGVVLFWDFHITDFKKYAKMKGLRAPLSFKIYNYAFYLNYGNQEYRRNKGMI